MSTLETRFPAFTPRNVAPQTLGRQQFRQFAAPGATPLPPVTPANAELKRRTFMALGVDLVGAIGQSIQQAQAMEAAQEEEIARELGGAGSLAGRTMAAELKERIAAGEMDHLIDGDGPISAQVNAFIEQQAEGAPAPWAASFREALLPALTGAAAKRQADVQRQTREQNVELLKEAAIQATTADEIQAAVNDAREKYGLDETEALSRIVVPALNSAAENDDLTRLQAAKQVLGDRFPDKRRNAEATFLAEQAERLNDEAQAIDGMFRDEVGQALASGNIDAAKAMIEDPPPGVTGNTLRVQASLVRSAAAEVQADTEAKTRTVIANTVARGVNAQFVTPDEAEPLDAVIGRAFAQAREAGLDDAETRRMVDHALRQEIEYAVQAVSEHSPDERDMILGLMEHLANTTQNRAFVQNQINAYNRQVGRTNDAIDKTATLDAWVAEGRSGPLSSEMDETFETWLASRGIISNVGDPDGNTTFGDILEPERLAQRAAQFLHMPSDATGMVAQAISVGQSPESTETAARTYLALRRFNPNMALQMRAQMSEVGRARADWLAEQMRRVEHQVVRPAGVDANGGQEFEADPRFVEGVRQALQSPQFAAIGRSELDRTRRLELALNEGDPFSSRIPNQVTELAREQLVEHLPEEFGDWYFGQDVSVSPAAVEHFVDLVSREYGIAEQLVPSEEGRAAVAVERAAQALQALRAPIVWNGVVHIDQTAPYPFRGFMEQDLRQDVQALIDQGQLEGPVQLEQYRPMWDSTIVTGESLTERPDQLPTGRTVGAWMLVDQATGAPLTLDNGDPFLYVPTMIDDSIEARRKRILETKRIHDAISQSQLPASARTSPDVQDEVELLHFPPAAREQMRRQQDQQPEASPNQRTSLDRAMDFIFDEPNP